MKKIWILLLAVLLLLPSCNTPPEDTTPPTPEVVTDPVLFENGEVLYTIVYPQGDFPYERIAAMKLASRMRSLLGVNVTYTDDKTAPTEHEILIGNTNRQTSGLSSIENDQIDIRVDGTRIVIRCGSNEFWEEAIDLFLKNLRIEEGRTTLSKDFQLTHNVQLPEVITMNVRIASFNIRNGADVKYDFRILAQDILKSGADVIGLQEVDQNTNRNKNQDTLADLAKYTGFQYYCYAKTEDFSGGEYGIGILSRFPILEHEYFYLPRGSDSPDEENRAVLYARIEVDGADFHFLNTHFGFGVTDTVQLVAIREYIREKQLPHYAIVGDYNYEIFETAINVFPTATLALTRDPYVNTYKELTSIDNFIMSKGIKLSGFQVYDTYASGHTDHKMLAGTLMLTVEKHS